MASLSRRTSTGSYSIQFEDRDDIRRTITLGIIPKRKAEEIRRHVEALVHSQIAGSSPDTATSRWVAASGERLIAKLAKVGLVSERRKGTLGAYIDSFLAEREADPRFKPRTLLSYSAPFKSLRDTFGDNRSLRSINKSDARTWRTVISKGRAENTTRKWTAKAKTLFNEAIECALIESNPFDGLPSNLVRVRERDHFVTDEVAKKVLNACPTLEWRIIFSLARYGGLRCPSEVLALRWGDIIWDQKRFMVHSIKTERHEGHETRIVPLFPELDQVLGEGFIEASEGDEYVISRRHDSSTNLRTQMQRIIKRSGVKPWPKLFQNLRSTRATELAEKFPGHVAAAWLGHSVEVAKESYWQVTDDHFEAAISKSAANALQKVQEPGSKESQQKSGTPVIAGVCDPMPFVASSLVAREGLEPPTKGL